MIHLSYEFHLHGLEGVRFGNHNVLFGVAKHAKSENADAGDCCELTTSKCPPSYGVPSGPGNDPFR